MNNTRRNSTLNMKAKTLNSVKPTTKSKHPQQRTKALNTQHKRMIYKNKKQSFATIIGQGNTNANHQQTYQFHPYGTTQSPMLDHFPENATFIRDFGVQNYPSASQALSRMEMVFENMPMVALNYEVKLKKIKLDQAQGKIYGAIKSQEALLSSLNTNVSYQGNFNIDIANAKTQQMTPFILGPTFSSQQPTNSSSNITSDNTSTMLITPHCGVGIGLNSKAVDNTFGPVLTNLILNYIKTKQYHKIIPIITESLNIDTELITTDGLLDIGKIISMISDNQTDGKAKLSKDMAILLISLHGYSLEHYLSSQIVVDPVKFALHKQKMSTTQTPEDNKTSEQTTRVNKPKFVLKTTTTTHDKSQPTPPKSTTAGGGPVKINTTTTNTTDAPNTESPSTSSTTTTPHNHQGGDKNKMDSIEDIITRKEACQKEQLKTQEQNDLKAQATGSNKETTGPVKKYPAVSDHFHHLLSPLHHTRCSTSSSSPTSHEQIKFDPKALLSPQLLSELDELPLKPIRSMASNGKEGELKPLSVHFIETLSPYLDALSLSFSFSPNSQLTPRNASHLIDTLTHISSLLNSLLPIYQQLESHKAKQTPALQQYLTVFNSLHSSLFHSTLLDHSSLPHKSTIDNNVDIDVNNNNNMTTSPQIYPYHVNIPTGPRILTSQLAIDSGSLPYLNATLKSSEKLLSFSDKAIMMNDLFKDNDVEYNNTNVQKVQHNDDNINQVGKIFDHYSQNKGSVLSPLLLAIGLEYISLNPINTEGLGRTAISYLEKQNHNHHSTKQQLVDAYLSHAYILSNLSWNGKLRTAESIGLVIKARDLIVAQNKNATGSVSSTTTIPLLPRSLAFKITHKFKTPGSIEANVGEKSTNWTTEGPEGTTLWDNDPVVDWDDITKHGQDYNITFTPIRRGVSTWIEQKYGM